MYYWHGYSQFVFWFWLFGLIVAAVGFKIKDSVANRKTTAPLATHASDLSPTLKDSWLHRHKRDIVIIFVLLVVCAPLYLLYLHSLPVQVNTDEVTIMVFQRSLANTPGIDLFGLSSYEGLPSFIFIVMGKLGMLIGGVTLYHMRLIHALSGLMIVIISYIFFRQNLPRRWAFTAAAILSTSHSLLMISRMAMRENTALLIETLALALFYFGFSNQNRFWTFIGGAIAGLSFYTYFPSRITMVVWMLFIMCWVMLYAPKKERLNLGIFSLIGLLGFFMVMAPYAIASSKNFKIANRHPQQQILLYSESRKLQQSWINANTSEAAYKRNIVNGLTVFNNKIKDNGNIYINYGHGFVDPFSGALVWLGVLIVLWRFLRRHSRQPFDLLMLVGFITIWLMLAFVINKAPNYTRLLVILPFMAYMVVMALRLLAELLGKQARRINLKLGTLTHLTVLAFGLTSIIGWNLLIAGDYIKRGRAAGDAIGTTARYIEARAGQSHHFYLATDLQYPYYDWGNAQDQWEQWAGFFASPGQAVQVVPPQNTDIYSATDQHFTIFMNNGVWLQNEYTLRYRYANLQKHLITSDGQLLAIEIP